MKAWIVSSQDEETIQGEEIIWGNKVPSSLEINICGNKRNTFFSFYEDSNLFPLLCIVSSFLSNWTFFSSNLKKLASTYFKKLEFVVLRFRIVPYYYFFLQQLNQSKDQNSDLTQVRLRLTQMWFEIWILTGSIN